MKNVRRTWLASAARRALICFGLLTLIIGNPGCLHFGPPSEEDQAEYNLWVKQVTPKEREKVATDAALHTDWTDKQRMIWSTEQFKHFAFNAQRTERKALRAATAASSATSQP